MRRAVLAAANGTGRHRHGAVLVRGGRVLAVGWNRSRVRDTWVTYQPRDACSLHAEVAAVRNVCATGATLIVVRLTRSGQLASSKPCPACWDTLDAAGVRRVVHS
ncbi:MAG: hypothetical protein ABWZ77_05200 [Naasia sp.]